MSGRMASYIPGGGADHAAEAKRAAAWAERARRDAMKHIARDLPDPVEFARYLSGEEYFALETAYWSEHWKVSPTAAPVLRPAGLVECGGCGLTAFGLAVIRALKEADA